MDVDPSADIRKQRYTVIHEILFDFRLDQESAPDVMQQDEI